MMEDCIVIENEWTLGGIEVEDDFDFGLTVESGFDISVEAEFDDESEIHLVMGEIVEKSKAEETEYDSEMMFSGGEANYVYVGPQLPAVDAEWSTDAWFRNDGWFDSEGW